MRRYFVGAATTEYSPLTNLPALPELVDELHRATELFTSLGYVVVEGFGVNMTAVNFSGQLREFLRNPERSPDDVVAVYYTGHGQATANGTDLLLPMADATGDKTFSYLRAGDLTGRLLDSDEPGEVVSQQLLYILDTCYAGAASGPLAAGAASFVSRLRAASGPSVAVIVAARDYQQAEVGTFTRALAEAVNNRAIAGHEVRFVPLDPLITLVNNVIAEPGQGTVARQHARLLYIGERAGEFFPNKQYDQWYSALDVRTRDLRLQQEARRGDRDEVALAAQGLASFTGRYDLWLFTGRYAALRQATSWLAGAGPPVMVVTGRPGSGKSALLARLDTLADQSRIARVPNVHLLPPDTLPPAGSINRFIRARGLSPLGLLAGLAEACGIDDIAAVDTPGKLVSRLRDRTGPITIIIDGVDEAAAEPGDSIRGGVTMVEQVLAPLVAAASRTPLRLLIGTRSNLVPALGLPADVVNLDRAGYADRPSVHRYVQMCLTDLVETSPYRERAQDYLGAVVDAVAGAAGDSFLVALITARSLALREHAIADPYDSAWRSALPREAAEAMSQDLSSRLGEEAERARDLLLPLAYAQASGLPWEDLWPHLVTKLTGRRCENADLDWLFENAGYYINETQLGRSSAYRLYHAALGAHLCAERNPTTDHTIIMETLIDRVPKRHDGSADWSRAHPYTAAAIAGHASHADRIDQLIADPRLMTETPPGPLLTALPSARTPRAHAAADAYRRAIGRMQAHPAERASYLQLAARCARAPHLADDITISDLPLPWTTHWASWRMQPPHQTLTWHTGPVNAVALGELAGRMVAASASVDRRLRLWDATSGRSLGEPLIGHNDWVTSVVFGQLNGKTIVISGATDRTVRFWDAATGRPLPGKLCRLEHPVRSVAFGVLDDRPVVVAGGDGDVVVIYDAATRQPLGRPFAGHTAAINTVACGQLHRQLVVASGSADGTIRVWEAATGRPAGPPLAGHEGRVRSVAFGRLGDETIVISGGDDGTVRVWSPDTGQQLAPPYTGHCDSVNAVVFGRNATLPVVVSASNDQTVQMWDLVTGRLIRVRYNGHTGGVRSVAFSVRNGQPIIVSGGEDDTVRLWDAASGEPVGEPFTGHRGTVRTIAVGDLAGQPVVASGSDDRTVRLWDVASGQSVGSPLTGHTEPVAAVAFTAANGQPLIASGGADETVRLWDAETHAPVGGPMAAPGQIRSVAFGQLGTQPVLAAGGTDETIWLWDTASQRRVGQPLEGHEAPVNAIAFGDLDGRSVIASASDDQTVRLWDVASGEPVGPPLTGHTDAVTALAFTIVDGQPVIASGGDDETVRLWNAASGEPVSNPIDGPGKVRSVAFGQVSGRAVVASAGTGPNLQLNDGTSGELIRTFFAGHDGVRSVAFGELGRQSIVVAGGADRALRAWNAATGRPVAAPFSGHNSPVTAVAFGRIEGTLAVVSASTDRTVRIWDAGTGTPLAAPFSGHTDTVRSVVFGQINGRAVIASGSEDRTVRIWDAASGELFGPPLRHYSLVNSVAFGEVDGLAVIVSGSNDHSVQIWDAETRKLVLELANAHKGNVSAVALGHLRERPVIVSGGKDHVVKLWDARSGHLIGKAFAGHSDEVNAVALGDSSGQPVVVSAGNDGTVRTWNAATGKLIGKPFTGHEGWVRTVAVGQRHDLATVVSGGDDHSVYIRAIALGEPGAESHGTRIQLAATVNCVAVRDASHLVIGTDLGIVSIRLPG